MSFSPPQLVESSQAYEYMPNSVQWSFAALGYYWVFYVDNMRYHINYTISTDGVSWFPPVDTGISVLNGSYWAMYFNPSDGNVYIVNQQIYGNPLVYSIGAPQSDGSISWSGIFNTNAFTQSYPTVMSLSIVASSPSDVWVAVGDEGPDGNTGENVYVEVWYNNGGGFAQELSMLMGDTTAVFDSGTASAGSTDTVLVDSTKAWTLNQWQGGTYYLGYTSGPNINQTQPIESNTATTLTTFFPFGSAPDVGDSYVIYQWHNIDTPYPIISEVSNGIILAFNWNVGSPSFNSVIYFTETTQATPNVWSFPVSTSSLHSYGTATAGFVTDAPNNRLYIGASNRLNQKPALLTYTWGGTITETDILTTQGVPYLVPTYAAEATLCLVGSTFHLIYTDEEPPYANVYGIQSVDAYTSPTTGHWTTPTLISRAEFNTMGLHVAPPNGVNPLVVWQSTNWSLPTISAKAALLYPTNPNTLVFQTGTSDSEESTWIYRDPHQKAGDYIIKWTNGAGANPDVCIAVYVFPLTGAYYPEDVTFVEYGDISPAFLSMPPYGGITSGAATDVAIDSPVLGQTVTTDSTQNWTWDSFVGMYLIYTSGAAQGMAQEILSNTASTITTLNFGAAPSMGDTYNIVDGMYLYGIGNGNALISVDPSATMTVIEGDSGSQNSTVGHDTPIHLTPNVQSFDATNGGWVLSGIGIRNNTPVTPSYTSIEFNRTQSSGQFAYSLPADSYVVIVLSSGWWPVAVEPQLGYYYPSPLFGASNQTPSGLYSIDPTDAATVLIGNMGINGSGGLAFSPSDILYAIGADPVSGEWSLWTVDPITATSTKVGHLLSDGGEVEIQDITFAPNGTLYGVDYIPPSLPKKVGAPTPVSLYTIDPATAAVTQLFVLTSGVVGNGLACDLAGTLLYQTGETMYVLDPVAMTQTPICGSTPDFTGMKCNSRGYLFGNEYATDELYYYDFSTCTAWDIGNTGIDPHSIASPMTSVVPIAETPVATDEVTVGVGIYVPETPTATENITIARGVIVPEIATAIDSVSVTRIITIAETPHALDFVVPVGSHINIAEVALATEMIYVKRLPQALPASGAYPLNAQETDYIGLSYRQMIDMIGLQVLYKVQKIVGLDEYNHPIIEYNDHLVQAVISRLSDTEYDYVETGFLPTHYAKMWVYGIQPQIGDRVLWMGIMWEIRNSMPMVIGNVVVYYNVLLRRVLAAGHGQGEQPPIEGSLYSGGTLPTPTGDP